MQREAPLLDSDAPAVPSGNAIVLECRGAACERIENETLGTPRG